MFGCKRLPPSTHMHYSFLRWRLSKKQQMKMILCVCMSVLPKRLVFTVMDKCVLFFSISLALLSWTFSKFCPFTSKIFTAWKTRHRNTQVKTMNSKIDAQLLFLDVWFSSSTFLLSGFPSHTLHIKLKDDRPHLTKEDPTNEGFSLLPSKSWTILVYDFSKIKC